MDAEALKIALIQKVLTVEDKRKSVKVIQKGILVSERRASLTSFSTESYLVYGLYDGFAQ